MDPRLPLPNCLRCPALALFRKYNYPDSKMVEAFQDPVLKEHLKLISEATVEIKDDGLIEEYGRSIEPEHITRRVRGSHSASSGGISGGADPRPEQEGKDAGAGVEARKGEGEHCKDSSPSGGVSKSTE